MRLHSRSLWVSTTLPLLLGVTALSGCAFLDKLGVKPSGPSEESPIESTDGSNPDATPFELQILEEINDGSRLTVRGRFVTKTEWNPAQIVVRLSALDEDGEQRLSYFPVVESMTGPKVDMLEAGKSTDFTVSILSAGLSNYQVELLWGADAAPFLAAAPASNPEQFLALRNLEVHRIPGDNCASPDECVVQFNITGEFFNSGTATVSQILLRAGFLPADKLALQGQIFENERRIEVRNLRLGPNEKKPFRLTLEKLVPSSTQMAPKPIVQIESFESDVL